MLAAVRLVVALALVVAQGSGLPAAASSPPPEQTVTAIESPVEQRIEVLDSPDEQRVEAIDPAEAQAISEGTKDPRNRGLRTAGKVVVGVFAAVFSLAAMVALLLV